MSKLTCPIVRDLLPLYIDQVVSPETAQAVEDHLADCPDCRGEYESLKTDLPVPTEEADTSRQFGTFIKKVKRTQKLSDVVTILLLLAALLAIFLWQPPRVNANEGVTVYRTYQFEDAEWGPSFFLVYSTPMYGGEISSSCGVREKDGKQVCQIDFDRKITKKADSVTESAMTLSLPNASEVDEVHLGDQVIWTREANGDDPVPAYVSAYANAEELYYFTFELDGEENFTEYPAPFIMYYPTPYDADDTRQIVWDLDGNVLYERP